jgi:proline dehydrogenase
MLRRVLLAASESARLRAFAQDHRLGRRVSRRFVAGETLEDAMAVVDRLGAAGFLLSLNHLGEKTTNPADADAAAAAYREIIDRLRGRPDCYVSVKLTQLGLDGDPAGAVDRLRAILQAARPAGTFVRVDMEHSAYVERTLEALVRLQAEGYQGLGGVIQAYLYRSPGDLDRLLAAGVPVRLVKGAYMEPPGIAFPRKADVDAAYVRLLHRLLADRGYHAVATHDERMIAAALEEARRLGKTPDQYEFQMIHGVRRDLQERLRQQGYRVRVYIPYGTQWYPYFVRRLAERPANVVFLLRNLVRG